MGFCPKGCTGLLCRSGGDLDTNQLMKLQHIREQKLVINLASYLKRWSQGDQQGFRVSTGHGMNKLAPQWLLGRFGVSPDEQRGSPRDHGARPARVQAAPALHGAWLLSMLR